MHAINRALLVTAAVSLATSAAHAQVSTLSGAYIGEDKLDRAPIFTQSAFLAPQGHYGVVVQGGRESMSTAVTGDTKFITTGAIFGAFYGITDKITLAADLPYVSAGVDGADSESGMSDIGVSARMRAFRSTTGATRVSVGAAATLPTGQEGFSNDDPTYNVGAAMSHRMNRVTFHVAPAIRLVKDFDMSYDLDIAASYAATSKLGISLEAMNGFNGMPSGVDGDRTRLTDIGAGVRYNAAENLMVDLGLRSNVSTNVEGLDLSRNMVSVGFGWMF